MIRFLKNHKKKVVLVVSLMVFILWIVWGNSTIEVSHLTISNKKIPVTFNGYKIAHVSDLHNKDWGGDLISPIREEEPDIIVITGDLIDSYRTNIDIATEFIQQINDIAPIYFVTGNHEAKTSEYEELREILIEEGVMILDNESIILKGGSEQILLAGVVDPSFYGENYLWEESSFNFNSTIKELTEEYSGFSILLSHRPEYFDLYRENKVDLTLSGHAHGGQIRIPFLGGLIAPGQGFFPEYTTGIYQKDGSAMIVSRGLGDSIISWRFNNRPELVFVHLEN